MPSSPPRMQRSSSLLLDRGARLFNADERLLLQEKGRMRISGRESARGRPTTQGPSWQQDRKEGWRVHAPTITNAYDRRLQQGENVGLVAWRRLTCVVSEIAGHTRAHAEARGDLHGCRHLYTLRTRNGTGHPAAPSPCRRNRATCAFAAGGLLRFAHRTSKILALKRPRQ